jgi:hypothetical protein
MTKPMETAAYFQAHKDDDTEWGEPVSSGGGTSRRLASMISIRLAPEEADRVRAAANERGETLSQFVREAALNEASASLGRAWIEFNMAYSLAGAVSSSIRLANTMTVGFVANNNSAVFA